MQISFSEILVILLVALLVIKPEKLPDAIRTFSRCVKWMRQSALKVKQEIDKPLDLFSRYENKLSDVTKQTDEMHS